VPLFEECQRFGCKGVGAHHSGVLRAVASGIAAQSGVDDGGAPFPPP
jgi:hypothetical protein